MERDPARWKDDPQIEAAMRDDLSRVAGLPAPAIDVDAGAARLDAAIRGGGTGGMGAAGPWIAGAVVVAAIGGALWWWLSGDDEPQRERAIAAAPPAEIAVEPEPGPAPAAEAPALPEPEPIEAPAPRHRPRTRAILEAEAPPSPPPHRPYSLQEEMEHLDRTRRAVDRDPARALALSEEGERRFPAPEGRYREEREGYAILALVRLGRRDEAQRRGQRYLAVHPAGPLSGPVRRALAAPR